MGPAIHRKDKGVAISPALAPESLIRNKKILFWFKKKCVERNMTLRRGGEILGLIGDKGLLHTAKTL